MRNVACKYAVGETRCSIVDANRSAASPSIAAGITRAGVVINSDRISRKHGSRG